MLEISTTMAAPPGEGCACSLPMPPASCQKEGRGGLLLESLTVWMKARASLCLPGAGRQRKSMSMSLPLTVTMFYVRAGQGGVNSPPAVQPASFLPPAPVPPSPCSILISFLFPLFDELPQACENSPFWRPVRKSCCVPLFSLHGYKEGQLGG